MQLRPYQEILKQQTYDAWTSGLQNIGLQLSTGGGKTALFSKIISEHYDDRTITIAHRNEIVGQISLTLASYGVRHNIIAPKPTIKEIIALHMNVIGRNYYHPQALGSVAGVDTLLNLNAQEHSWFSKVRLVVQDEGHHVLKHNKWGRAANLFPNAKGLYPTATPLRADGYGLGRDSDGIIDTLIEGPPMRELIRLGYLTDYRIFAPPSDLDLSTVSISAGGDYSPPKLRNAVHKSHITGDVVSHYLRIAPGKLGITFAVDIEAATEIAREFRARGVPAEVISSDTPTLLRSNIMQRFRRREILQLVNVDLLGEGVDVPAIEVVSMARPTQSFGLYCQQFGRAVRPMEGKLYAIIIDHVGNVMRHGLPDAPRIWSLERREKRMRAGPTDAIPVRTCLNIECMSVYERVYSKCPYCGFCTPPSTRSAPQFVDGDLLELDQQALALLRGEIDKTDSAVRVPKYLDPIAQRAIMNRHLEKQQAQGGLRQSIALWAGYQKSLGREDSEIYRRFYFSFGMDVLTAQTLNSKESEKLQALIENKLAIDHVVNSSYTG